MRPGIQVYPLLLFFVLRAAGQDPFEIHVYEYETLHRGEFTLEAHLNYDAIAAKSSVAPLAPANDQFHMTGELTAGLTDFSSLGFMLLGAHRPGASGPEYAGWRLLPHFYAPKSWNLPFDAGLVVEFSFQSGVYEENSRRVEIRPILEKKLGRLQLDANPVFERRLHGPGVREGWSFEPAGRIGFEAGGRVRPSIEYYSVLGPLPDFLPRGEQVHQLFPGADIRLSERLVWSAGIGVGVTSAGPRLVYKSRFEFSFGGNP